MAPSAGLAHSPCQLVVELKRRPPTEFNTRPVAAHDEGQKQAIRIGAPSKRTQSESDHLGRKTNRQSPAPSRKGERVTAQ